jgi:tRNA nucleotidyltransferase (CCA-adding enzyme)
MEEVQTTTSGGKWEHFLPVADMGIRGFGDTRAEAFAHAALALTAIIGATPFSVEIRDNLVLNCH